MNILQEGAKNVIEFLNILTTLVAAFAIIRVIRSGKKVISGLLL